MSRATMVAISKRPRFRYVKKESGDTLGHDKRRACLCLASGHFYAEHGYGHRAGQAGEGQTRGATCRRWNIICRALVEMGCLLFKEMHQPEKVFILPTIHLPVLFPLPWHPHPRLSLALSQTTVRDPNPTIHAHLTNPPTHRNDGLLQIRLQGHFPHGACRQRRRCPILVQISPETIQSFHRSCISSTSQDPDRATRGWP